MIQRQPILPKQTLQGRTAWLISDKKAGSDAQCRGVAEALGLNFEIKTVAPTGIYKFLSPWLAPSAKHKIGQPTSQFAQPWPDVVMAASRLSIPFLRAIRKASKNRTYAIIFLDPKVSTTAADIIWVPEHDRLRGGNVITTLTPPHKFSPNRLKQNRPKAQEKLSHLPAPCIMLSLGGSNAVFKYTEEALKRLHAALQNLVEQNVSFLITPSRRTPAPLLETALDATTKANRTVWDGTGPNPYEDFLSASDATIITADSISMASEACATGRPVYIFKPDGGSAKFSRFHEALQTYGATRTLTAQTNISDSWTYEPLFSTDEIANKIEQHWIMSRKA